MASSFDAQLLVWDGTAVMTAQYVGAPPGARVLNSDRVRKRLHGVPAETRLPQSAYRPDVSDSVYATLRRESRRTLASGGSVIVDAVFNRPAERAATEAVAIDANIPFHGVWLEAPPSTLVSRIKSRRNDPSDATTDVLLAQVQRKFGEISWQRLDAEADAETIKDAILAEIGIRS